MNERLKRGCEYLGGGALGLLACLGPVSAVWATVESMSRLRDTSLPPEGKVLVGGLMAAKGLFLLAVSTGIGVPAMLEVLAGGRLEKIVGDGSVGSLS